MLVASSCHTFEQLLSQTAGVSYAWKINATPENYWRIVPVSHDEVNEILSKHKVTKN